MINCDNSPARLPSCLFATWSFIHEFSRDKKNHLRRAVFIYRVHDPRERSWRNGGAATDPFTRRWRTDGANRPPYHSSYRHERTRKPWRNEITSSNCESRSTGRVARKKAEGAPGTWFIWVDNDLWRRYGSPLKIVPPRLDLFSGSTRLADFLPRYTAATTRRSAPSLFFPFSGWIKIALYFDPREVRPVVR